MSTIVRLYLLTRADGATLQVALDVQDIRFGTKRKRATLLPSWAIDARLIERITEGAGASARYVTRYVPCSIIERAGERFVIPSPVLPQAFNKKEDFHADQH